MQVPPATNPTWSDLLTGKSRHEPAFLAARMFIVRSRLELGKVNNAPDKIKKLATDLRELFAQNAECPSVQQDMAKLFK